MKAISYAASVLFLAVACEKAPPVTDGIITFVKGSALIEHVDPDGSKKTKPARQGEKVFVGDAVVTADASTVIFEVTGAKIEIQRNTRFVYERGGEDKQVYLQNGNAWTSVSKLSENGRFALRTPTTVAGVRGTKFFTFTDGATTGTCHCEGKIAYKNLATGKEEVNDQDYVMYYRGNKAVTVMVDDLKKMRLPVGHNHSELDNSTIGKKNNLTPAQLQKWQEYVDKKFSALK